MGEQILFSGKRFNVHRLETTGSDGQTHVKEIVRHPGAVVLLPLLGDDSVVLIRNYRAAVEQTLLELPAGTIDPGETPEQTGARELVEETGYRAESLRRLITFYSSPGITDEAMHLIVAEGLTAGAPEREADEQIENEVASWSQIRRWLSDGTIRDAKTLVGLHAYLYGMQ